LQSTNDPIRIPIPTIPLPGTRDENDPSPSKDIGRIINDVYDYLCPPEDSDECKKLRADVQRAKKKVRSFSPAACLPRMSPWELTQRRDAWLEEATARAIRDQKCYDGGDETHQGQQATAWQHVGQCNRLLQ
jgi:Novel toxin 16